MVLRLVIDNTDKKKKETLPTCRLNCELFDHVTGKCGINHDINPDDPYLAARCGDMIYRAELDDFDIFWDMEKIEPHELEEDIIDDFANDIFFEFNGEIFEEKTSKYPTEPDYPSNRDDAVWYVSPCKTFGCWIINKSKKRYRVVSKDQEVKVGWNKNVYKSPYPLHNHNASKTIASRMAWYVDEEGYGQYVMLHNGKISMITSPKPFD